MTSKVINRTIDEEYYARYEIGASDIMIESLFKMAEYCHTNRVKFILINTPLHSKFKSEIPEYYFKLHNRVLFNLKNRYNNIYYFGFSFENYLNSLLGDGDHLNALGTKRFSKEIKDLVSK
ncbi:MAG: hypothetical protein A2W30_02755 [Ignavibacteria bacterium RBG_16_36_9]|nr:MAG: hypothetical protein A2W30_02755 [Ignavibacteria bacterium RBG_16_36_9]